MPKKKEADNQPYLLEELRDMDDELEENVGGVPRKVTEEDVVGAENAFKQLMESEERVYETTPFRPGKNAIFVLTDNQRLALKGCVRELEKYFKYENRHEDTKEDNKKLQDLHTAMKKILERGLDSLSADERKTVNEFNNIMDADYHRDPQVKTLIQHIDNVSGTYDIKMSKFHKGLDMLGVMTGIPATYEKNRAGKYLDDRAWARKSLVKSKFLNHPEEISALSETAKMAGIADLQAKFSGTEIGEKLGQINNIVKDLGNWTHGSYNIEDHLKAADGLGAFLNAKDKDGKTNYDKIAQKILGKEQDNEQKKAFDMLLSQLNTVCDLDIGISYAIEAQEEYAWNKEQKALVDSARIEELNKKIFGERTIHARDKDFLESVEFMNKMIQETNKNLEPRTESLTRMRNASLGFESIVKKVKSNSAFARLDTENENYVHVLDFGKTLHRKEGDKTLYEKLLEQYEKNNKSKADLDKTLDELNKRMDLKIAVPGQKRKEGETEPEQVEQHSPYVRKIDEVQRSSNKMDDPVQLKLALASVLALRRMSVDPAHKDHKKVRTKAAYAKAMALMETKAFKEMTKDMSVEELARKIHHPGNFDKDFIDKIKACDQAEYENRLKDKRTQDRLAACAKNSAARMDKTGTGVYLLGVKRRSNSGMYDRALLAMQRAGNNPDAATTMQSVQTVKEYLSNKMSRRSSPSGRERWQSCMEFLHEAMPADEFKEYCEQINSVRKAKEGSPDHIRPEQFDPQPQRNSAPTELGKTADRKNVQEKDPEEAAPEQGVSRNTI